MPQFPDLQQGLRVRCLRDATNVQGGTRVAGRGWWGAVDGLVKAGQAEAIAKGLARDATQAPGEPVQPWVACLVFDTGSVVLAASTTQRAGWFWAVDETPSGVQLTASTDPATVVTERPASTRLDRRWLLEYLDPGTSTARSWLTPFIGVRRTPAGHTMVWCPAASLGSARPLVQPWPLPWPLPLQRVAWDHARDAIAEYRARLDLVVAQMLQDSDPIVAELSGGLDSTTVVATCATSEARAGRTITALTSVPLPGAAMDVGRWVPNELEYAQALARHHKGAIDVVPVSNVHRRQPLEAAADASLRSWLPCFSPANQVWMDQIRNVTRDLAVNRLIVGSHGNWSFSRNGAPASWHRRLAHIRRRQIGYLSAEPRRPYLLGLTGHSNPHNAVFHPAAQEGVWRLDPFASRPIIDVAAQLTSREWGMEPWPRGFARTVAHDRVPDVIRLRRARGAQAPDVWTWIQDQEERYRHEVRLFSETELLDGAVNLTHLRATVFGWPWGEPNGPSLQSMARVHRVLALGGYVRMMERRLEELAVAKQRGR